MVHRQMGYLHAQFHHLRVRLTEPSGQGTVEYVALILLVAGVLAAVVATGRKGGDHGISAKIIGELKQAIDSVGK